MEVPYNYLPFEYENTTNIFEEWKELIRSTDFTLGYYVAEFEKIFAANVGAKHCISTNNGTDALILCLKSLGIGAGDEVITVTNTFYATVGAIVAVGATPVLVDSDERYQICISSLEAAINKKTKAILPVHWGGASPDMQSIVDIASGFGIPVVEDACMGIGGSILGKHPGTFGIVSAFSMHPLKSLNVMGDGGMVITNDDNLAEWMFKYRNHGMINRDNIEFWGVNMRLQPLQAVVAKHRLRDLEKTILTRNANAKFYDQALSELKKFITLPARPEGYKETFSLYMGEFSDRDNLKKYLEEKGVEVKIHYPIPLHKQKAANTNCITFGRMTKSESQAKSLLTIPVHQYLSSAQLEYACEQISNFYIK